MLFDQSSFMHTGLMALLTILAFAVSAAIAPLVIRGLRKLKFGQVISEDGPASHASKEGTPTLGGIIFIPVLILSLIPFFKISPGYSEAIAVLLLALCYAGLGFVDDFLTIKPKNGVRGIASKPKALLQFVISLVFVIYLAVSRSPAENTLVLGNKVLFSGLLYHLFALVFLVGMANFINITDGLDGLASGLAAICCVAMAVVMMATNELVMLPIIAALLGGVLAFLWYNTNPAKVFMGDTGSLVIGAILPAAALVTHSEVFLIIAGAVFILDGLSSAVQWLVFKTTRIRTGSGRRVFLKSPVHHHFELRGHSEQAVVVRFWIAGIIAAALGMIYVWGLA